jgi:hypothetical protein
MPWLALAGIGIGLVTAPTTTAALGATDSVGYGAVAGVFNTFRATGLTLGIAIMGVILASFGRGAAFSRGFGPAHHAAFAQGLSTAVTLNALIAAVTAALTIRPRPGQAS